MALLWLALLLPPLPLDPQPHPPPPAASSFPFAVLEYDDPYPELEVAAEGSLSAVVSALLLALPQVLLAAEGLVELVLADDGVLKKRDYFHFFIISDKIQ